MLKLTVFTLIVVLGQLTFKRVAQGLGQMSGMSSMLRHLAFDPWFIAALALYGGATVLWVMVLRETPLSKAYIFVALAFALVPIGAAVFFHEALGPRYYLGLVLVIAGVAVIGSDNAVGTVNHEIAGALR
jgi:undecaprenyl phosphate-alpha-L-ara4N flippase subunit ArnE